MSHDDWPDWLPGDWSVHIRTVDGRKVKCYVDPDGHKCYSKPQVFDYLKKTNKSLPADKPQNAEGPAIDLSAEPTAPHTDEGPESTPGGPPTKLTPRSNRRKSISTDLSEDFLGGDGSSSEPSSHKRHRGDCNWLPEGWTVEDKVRQGGSSSGIKYKVYIDPVSGQKFFSKPQVLNHIAKTNSSAGVQEAEPSSHKRHRGDCNWLPEGWTVEDKVRQGGSSSGIKYKVYINPVSGQKFFSKPQVLNHIAKTNSSAGVQEAVFAEPISAMLISSWQEKPTTEPDNSQMYEATEAEKKTEDKTEISRLSSDDEVVTRTPAEGLPPGWIKEVRRRKSSGGATRSDPYYLDPLSEYAFASKKDALRYLESGDIKTCVSRPRKKNMNNNDTLNVNLTSTGGELPAQTDQSNGNEASKEFVNGSAEELKTNESGIPNPQPLRSISGASFSTPEKDKWLPDGWLVDVRYKTSGMKYKIYKDPATGKLFYSKPQVLSYLGNGSSSSSRKRKEHNSSVAPDSSPNSTPADVRRPKRSVKKKGDSQNTEYQEVITTSAADGLPPGWIKETRTKIYATHKRNDPFYTDPETGYIFRSKADALRYIETGDVNLCAIRPKVKDKDGKEVYVYANDAQKPTTGDDVATEVPEENHTPDPKTANDTNRRVTKNSSPATDSPSRSSKRQKGKDPETAPTSGVPTEKQETGVNLEKQPDDGNLAFDIPEDDNWTDQCIDFAVKTLTDEIMFNGQPVETTGVKDTPSKVN